MNRLPLKTAFFGAAIILGVSLTIVINASPSAHKIKPTIEQNTDEVKKAQIRSIYGKLPLSFIQNGGQVNNIIRLSSMKREAVMRLSSPKTGSI